MKHALFLLPCRLASVPLLPVFRLCLSKRSWEEWEEATMVRSFVFLLSSAPLPPSQIRVSIPKSNRVVTFPPISWVMSNYAALF